MEFEELVSFRADLREFAQFHERSVNHFYDPESGWFRVYVPIDSSNGTPGGLKPDKSVRHLTSTLTCIESLAQTSATEGKRSHGPDWREVLADFSTRALESPADWSSDGAAHVYCRVRTLGAMLRLFRTSATRWTRPHRESLARLLEYAWASNDQGPIYGLREASGIDTIPSVNKRGHGRALTALATQDRAEAYPSNAFLTYWGLVALENCPEGEEFSSLWTKHQDSARTWLDASVGHQVAYFALKSEHADPQQLAWALCSTVRFARGDLNSKTSPEYIRFVAGLESFFAQEDGEGSWKTGQPLFHYPNAGNAYCYIYETLAELLHLATGEHEYSSVLGEALRPYAAHLRRAFDAAVHSAQRPEPGTRCWSSGHHPHRLQPESWATASVFAFVQAARKLVGRWTANEAQLLLGAVTPTETIEDLGDRGGSWDVGRGSVGVQLATRFLNPILRSGGANLGAFVDPDLPVIPRTGSRSAILFGPPGTSKTTLVRAVAGSLNWPFIEITPAQFLDAGMDLVSKRADEIFRQVMELDRCVVLLDEIDELIQLRDDRADPVERFFTTSMLPRLAKLWETGRVLFFANTNDISRVDPAIRRSQRFDAAIMVLPPGHRRKVEILARERYEWPISELIVTSALVEGDGTSDLAWFALVRYDQVVRLAQALKKARAKSESSVARVLGEFANELRQLDWLAQAESIRKGPPEEATEEPPSARSLVQPMLDSQRQDHNAVPVVRVSKEARGLRGGAEWLEVPSAKHDRPDIWVVEYSEGAWRLADNGIACPVEQ